MCVFIFIRLRPRSIEVPERRIKNKIINWLFGSGDGYQKVFIEQHNPLPSYPEVVHGMAILGLSLKKRS